MEILDLILVFTAWLAFAAKRQLTYLHILQQEEYDSPRLWHWMRRYRVFDVCLSAALVIFAIAEFFLSGSSLMIAAAFGFGFVAFRESDPRTDSKKKLAVTDRAKRIFLLALALNLLVGIFVLYTQNMFLWVAGVQFIPFSLMLAVALLQPFENRIQKTFWQEAHEKITRLKPIVIGVTGSFGKTSVKHILGHILKTQAPTLITPGSVNTPMGITRIIREQLEENHKYFVVEMGAYGRGSIARLCKLVPPDLGIITAIGQAHYERFKSLDTVAQTKFELAEAVLAQNGQCIIHERTLRFAYTREMRGQHKDSFIVVGESGAKDLAYLEPDDWHINKAIQQMNGLEIHLSWKDETYSFTAPLYGLHHAHNVALAFATARALGIEAEHIIAALKSVPQIEHRLQVKHQADGGALIDDAFNSNPQGFRAALELLAILGASKRKILITPGMVELGAAHDEAHMEIGRLAGQLCDIALVVSSKRIPTFMDGFKNTGEEKTLIEVDTFAAASAWLDSNRKPGDIVLIENDLPDLYERVPRL